MVERKAVRCSGPVHHSIHPGKLPAVARGPTLKILEVIVDVRVGLSAAALPVYTGPAAPHRKARPMPR